MSELPVRETGMTWCFSHCSFGDELQDLGVDLVLLEVDRRDAVLLREEVRDLVVGDVAELGEREAEVAAGPLLLLLGVREAAQSEMSFSRTRSSPRRFVFPMRAPRPAWPSRDGEVRARKKRP